MFELPTESANHLFLTCGSKRLMADIQLWFLASSPRATHRTQGLPRAEAQGMVSGGRLRSAGLRAGSRSPEAVSTGGFIRGRGVLAAVIVAAAASVMPRYGKTPILGRSVACLARGPASLAQTICRGALLEIADVGWGWGLAGVAALLTDCGPRARPGLEPRAVLREGWRTMHRCR